MPIFNKLPESWREELAEFLSTQSAILLDNKVEEAYGSSVCYPPKSMIFQAFELCQFSDLKVVIIGQDPYHGPGQAHGLSFSVPDGVDFPPSLRNIMKELQSDLGVQVPMSGNLRNWAEQGVLLLNTVLTVEHGKANSHAEFGWQKFTQSVIEAIDQKADQVVFVLWGKHAQGLKQYIQNSSHDIIESAHPSPLSAYRGFFGSNPFSRINALLSEERKINW